MIKKKKNPAPSCALQPYQPQATFIFKSLNLKFRNDFNVGLIAVYSLSLAFK